jgi:hypothetical protein
MEASANAVGGDVGASKMSPMGEAIQRILKELPHITTEELVADTVHYSNIATRGEYMYSPLIATTLRGAPDYLASMRLWQEKLPQVGFPNQVHRAQFRPAGAPAGGGAVEGGVARLRFAG